VVLHLITSPHFRQATVTPRLIVDLASLLSLTSGANAASSAATSASTQGSLVEFKGSLMHVLEAICQVSHLVQSIGPQMIIQFIHHLTPLLCLLLAAIGAPVATL
jgi:serine/threonine-protein kinase ULK4